MELLKCKRPATEQEVLVSMETLDEIPDNRLGYCFTEARKNNLNVTPPPDGKILDEWRKISGHASDQWNKTVMESMTRIVKNADKILSSKFDIHVCKPGGRPYKMRPDQYVDMARKYCEENNVVIGF